MPFGDKFGSDNGWASWRRINMNFFPSVWHNVYSRISSSKIKSKKNCQNYFYTLKEIFQFSCGIMTLFYY